MQPRDKLQVKSCSNILEMALKSCSVFCWLLKMWQLVPDNKTRNGKKLLSNYTIVLGTVKLLVLWNCCCMTVALPYGP